MKSKDQLVQFDGKYNPPLKRSKTAYSCTKCKWQWSEHGCRLPQISGSDIKIHCFYSCRTNNSHFFQVISSQKSRHFWSMVVEISYLWGTKQRDLWYRYTCCLITFLVWGWCELGGLLFQRFHLIISRIVSQTEEVASEWLSRNKQ